MAEKSQIELLADYIMLNIPGEPSQSEGAGDTAIRLLKLYRQKVQEHQAVIDVQESRIQALEQRADDFERYMKYIDDFMRSRRGREGYLPLGLREWLSSQQ